MSWEELNAKPPAEPDDAARVLQRELANTLEHNPELLKYLQTVVKSATYSTGRTLDQVAFGEGQRALARTLLQLGGKFHAQENDQENRKEG